MMKWLRQVVARVGVRPDDDPRTATIKASLVLVSGLVIVLSPAWIGIYLVLGRPLSAAIPGAYVIFSLALLAHMARTSLHVRVGIASGPLVAGVIGSRRFSYDLWGDTVNTAARMAGLAEPGSVVVADSTASLLDGVATLESRGETEVKGKGPMKIWSLESVASED